MEGLIATHRSQASNHQALMDKLLESNHTGYSHKTEKIIRSKLATLVHRKLAMTTPSIRYLAKTAPHKWAVMLQDAIDAVHVALNDSHQKMILKFSTSQIAQGQDKGSDSANATMAPPSRHFIDGIQPYICYRRLIVLASFVKVLCDNPLLPTELFSLADVDNGSPSIDAALYKAELALSGMERGVISSSQISQSALVAFEKYKSFDEVRRTLVARRIQALLRKFLNKDVAIPRSVRMNMAAGYLCHIRSPLREVTAKFFVKNREYYHEPWWGQLTVAEVYKFKLQYDMKAICLGVPSLPLSQAVVACSFRQWGCIELAERAIQDLFICIKAYRGGLPRLRLFAAFLGDGRELDETVAEMLRTQHAVSIYLNLLLEVHTELQQAQRDMPPGEDERELRAMGAVLESNSGFDGDRSRSATGRFFVIIIGLIPLTLPPHA